MNCVPEKVWSSWSSWGSCVRGKRIRTCNCISKNPDVCQGVLSEAQPCVDAPIWSSWTSWGECNGGKKVRTANCMSPNKAVCVGVLSESQPCGQPATPSPSPTSITQPTPTPTSPSTFCTAWNYRALNTCLSLRAFCFSWWNVNALRAAQGCFGSWGFTPAYINQFNQLFGPFLAQNT